MIFGLKVVKKGEYHGRQKICDLPDRQRQSYDSHSGNDTGFIKWSAKRKTEEFTWEVHADIYTAIIQLKEGDVIDIAPEKWEQWFDEVREF